MEHIAKVVTASLPPTAPNLEPSANSRPRNGQNGTAHLSAATCPRCRGIGWLLRETLAHPYGELERCPVCGQNRQDEYLREMCGLAGDLIEATFANTKRTRNNAAAFDAARGVAGTPSWFLTLTGPYGTGKTRLLACIVNAGRLAGVPAAYMTTAELLDHLRRAYAPNAPVSFDDVWEKVTTATILALDELDRWNPTPWAQEKFFELIDVRYRNGKEMLTAFATNAAIDALPGYLASRLRDKRSQVLELGGSDLRTVMQR